ncbi:MAG: winged helix-turn-helix domain-containing protein [Candidatus Bathycorpusculaceae bacterium]
MEDLSRYYTLLRDPARRKIIEILGIQEKIGFKELRETLGLGVGTVYYHLDMLSEFITQDKQRKYRLNDRGQALYRLLKEGTVPASLDISQTFSHKLGKWVFLSPLFAKTTKPLMFIPAIVVLVVGAFGAAQARLEPALFFYPSPFYPYSQLNIIFKYIFNWIGLFLFTEIFTYLLYRRVGNELQLFVCINLATIPLAAFPYIYLAVSEMLPTISSIDLSMIMQYVQIILQIWSILLVTAAICFGKGIRLDKAVVVSLTAVYLNLAILFMLGRFT